jgi:hypothetical protein
MFGQLSKADHECVTAHCYCLFWLRATPDSPVIASCVTPEAMQAAKRLLGK